MKLEKNDHHNTISREIGIWMLKDQMSKFGRIHSTFDRQKQGDIQITYLISYWICIVGVFMNKRRNVTAH